MLSPELQRLTRDFHKRPGTSEAALAKFEASVAPIPLPDDYLAFMARSNGAYGKTGEQGLWVRLDPIGDVLPMTRGHEAPPGLLLIGATRLGDGLAIDGRTRPAQVATVSLGWWGAFDVLDELGPSLESALQRLELMGPVAAPWVARSGHKLRAPYVPTPQPVVEAMLKAAEVKPGELVYDLGCGDGRIVIAAASKFGARGMGFDLDVELIQAARAAAVAANVRNLATFRWADLFTVDVSPADVVTLYLLPGVNARLLPQLRQLRPGARVVGYEFTLPGCEPARSEVVEYAPGLQGRIYVWVAPL